MSASRSLVAPTSNPLLERALLDKLHKRSLTCGSFGELEPLAVRLGLIQNTLKPRLRDPQVLLFASDHGLAVDGIAEAGRSTRDQVLQVLHARSPLTVFARQQGIALTVVDAGVADPLPAHELLLVRKIAHGTRNARVHAAMSLEQAHAAIRAGMEIAEAMPGNVALCAGLGVGADVSAALVLARLSQVPLRHLLWAGPTMTEATLAQLLLVAQSAQGRHRGVAEPVEVLAAFGGFEIAMLVGLMLAVAAKRQLLLVDGMAACAALRVAQRIAAPVTDYCVFCRSHGRQNLDHALGVFHASALLELGMDSIDGTGATLAWPLVKSAAALLTDVAEGDEPGPSRPAALDAALAGTPAPAGDSVR
ncbi:nicotinate-nucleotide--dimethylbenzimidazole phosphoribosyltransferase [Calidifontimicrobium sp. SYSU G02091]|uniref:nicotinate-nucleotide--dimethylbenzimidazole phosphoribosyltransferase n=1 Tax=Calidifontimicrobium sp. SYSU G02091 TaxID=2926421 RepID=UPI001F53B4DD|nr:nicotinate-nucleotide--dimethylbenzimidazole phosphoribosyltransferase [Calidifontimicrobium sp. SYSU G02091]MCI1190440.1 nicotinate-nucleotide--dimethylbenzimidazole phosphoribosyltransferase [Calidifontimicrobium sp. SYSU G02091]